MVLSSAVVSPLALMTSCGNSSSSENSHFGESPVSLDGKTLIGEMYVDYKTGDGFEVEAKNYVFNTANITFDEIFTDEEGKPYIHHETGTYVYTKTGASTATLQIDTRAVHYDLNLNFTASNVQVGGIMKEKASFEQTPLPAKGIFTLE